MAKKQKWPELGIITKNVVKDKDGNVVKDSKGNAVTKLGFKLADNVTILVDGQPVELNQSRSGILKSPVEETEGLYKAGVISDGDIEAKRAKAKDINEWLRYKITLPPPRSQD